MNRTKLISLAVGVILFFVLGIIVMNVYSGWRSDRLAADNFDEVGICLDGDTVTYYGKTSSQDNESLTVQYQYFNQSGETVNPGDFAPTNCRAIPENVLTKMK